MYKFYIIYESNGQKNQYTDNYTYNSINAAKDTMDAVINDCRNVLHLRILDCDIIPSNEWKMYFR